MSDGSATPTSLLARLPLLSWPVERAVVLSDVALLATVCAVVGLFLLSPVTLEARGIAYLTSGGGLLSKVHPSTLLALGALGFRCLAASRPLATAWRLTTSEGGVVLMLGAALITVAYAAAISHTPFTPLIDTFLLPVLMYLLLRDLDPALSRLIALLVVSIFCVNAVIAIVEFTRHWHLVSIPVPPDATADPTRGDASFDWRAQLANEWRATALLGHPLTNGLATGAFIIILAAPGSRWLSAVVKVPVVLLQSAAMFAFGARLALVLTIAGTAICLARSWRDELRAGRRLSPRGAAIFILTLGAIAGLGAFLWDSGFIDQTLDRFQRDEGSATTRITMLNLFAPLAWSDILLGPDPFVIATQQRLEGLEFGIESSWIGLLLTYGAVVTAILVAGLAAFSRSVLKVSEPGSGLLLVYFFVLVSGAASLSTKTTIFAITIVLVLLFLRKRDPGGQQARCASHRSSPAWP